MKTRSTAHSPRAFSLIELLVVVTIISLLAVVSLPSYQKINRGHRLTVSAQTVADQLNLARQVAEARNRPVEVRLYKLPDFNQPTTGSPTTYRAVQIFLLDSSSTNAITKAAYLQQPIAISTTEANTSLMDDTDLPEQQPGTTAPKLAGFNTNYRYRSFLFMPDGRTDLAVGKSWYITFYSQQEPTTGSNNLPANFVTIQIDPQTGHLQQFRP